MPNSLQFTVIELFDHDLFVTETEMMLNQGWQLHGPMVAFPNETTGGVVKTVRYLQAFIKETKPKAVGFSFG